MFALKVCFDMDGVSEYTASFMWWWRDYNMPKSVDLYLRVVHGKPNGKPYPDNGLPEYLKGI